jgi:WD40 repeat protein
MTGENLLTFGDYGGFKYAEWSPDGTRIATGCLYSADRMCPSRIWDAVTGELLQILESSHGDTHFLEWSPDSTQLATAHIDGTATVWDTSTGEAQTLFTGHDQWIPEVTWSPDGTRIASGDLAGLVKGWDADSGQEVFSFQVPGGVVRMDWAPDGEHLVVAGEYDAPIIRRVWQNTESLILHARDCCVFRELTPEERTQFMLGD